MNWWLLTVLVLGGLAIFLHGMTIMTDGLKAAAGNRMKQFLKTMTKNRWTSLLAGTGITAIIQSSSVTTVLAVGFVSAGLLSFQSTLGLILGANLGTTITAQIIAFKITKASWLMIAFGYLFAVIFAKKSYKDIGNIILGLGMVFLGMNVMSEATTPLKTYEPFIGLMKGMDNYMWGILTGTLFTAAVQSSSATTGIVIVLASQGLISTEAGISLILGANIGTCVTAVLSAFGKPKAAMRVAFSHIFFNVAGVIIWYFFIDQLALLVKTISENAPSRQIANAHTIFNMVNTFLFIWLTGPVAKLVLLILPQKKKIQKKLFPELHSYYLENNAMALELSHNAILKLGKNSLKIIQKGLNIALTGNSEQLTDLRKEDYYIDKGQTEILQFLRQVQSNKLSKKEIKILEQQIDTVNIVEVSADLITTNLVETAEHRIEKNFEASPTTIEKLTGLYQTAVDTYAFGLKKFDGRKKDCPEELSKSQFQKQFQNVSTYLSGRLYDNDEMHISVYRFESEILEATRRIHDLSRRLQRKGGQ